MALNRDAVTHDQIISPAGQKQVERKRPLPPLNNKGNTQIPPNRAKSWYVQRADRTVSTQALGETSVKARKQELERELEERQASSAGTG